MILRQRWAIAVLAAMAIVVSDAAAEIRPGKASLGGLVGVPFFLGDSELKDGQKPRLLGQANFQYLFSSNWRLSTQFGFGWIGYKPGTPAPYPAYDPDTGDSVLVRDDMLTKFQPIAATLIRSLKAQGKGWTPFIGAGANLTRIEIVNKRLEIKDPATFDAYVNWSPGVHAIGGFEYVLPSNSNVSFDWTARWTQLLRRNTESFPSGFTGKHSYVNFNFGVNLYFWPIGYKPVETAPTPTPDVSTPAPSTEVAPSTAPDAPETPAVPDTTQPKSSKDLPGAGGETRSLGDRAADPPVDHDAEEACPVMDLGPILGAPSRPHPVEGRREP